MRPSSALLSLACRLSIRTAPVRRRTNPRRPRPRAATLCCITPALLLVSSAAHAQGLRGILRTVERATRPDSTKRVAGTSGGVASGGAVRIVDQQVTGSDSLAQRFALDTGVTVVRAGGACGVARACAPGWDLRVARVALPGPLVPAGATVVATAEVENRGRQPAPPSELRLCFAQGGLAL